MAFWLEALLKGTSLLLVIFGLATVLKRSSAATRHLMWSFGLLGLLVLPILSRVMPWHLPLMPPANGAAVRERMPTVAPDAARVAEEDAGALGLAREETISKDVEEMAIPKDVAVKTAGTDGIARGFEGNALWPRTTSVIDPLTVLAALWLLGAVLILARLVVGLVNLGRFSRRARPANGPDWEATCEWARSRLLLDTPVRLLVNDEVAMPLTAGIFRPLVLMPSEAEEWPEDRRRAVILHELAHVKRRDVLPHLMAWGVCALWWFHPLAWGAARRMRSESEKACDDLVLKVGTRASRYADDLLDIVTRAGSARMPAAVVPLAQRSEFEGRILAILEADRKRQGVSIAYAALVALAVALFAVPLAAVGPRPARPRPSDLLAGVSAGTEPRHETRGLAAFPDAIADLVAESFSSQEGASEEPLLADPRGEKPAGEERLGAAPTEPEVVIVGPDAAGDLEYGYDHAEENGPPLPKADGRAVAALAVALGDHDPGVRMAAAEALGELQDPRAVEALSRALRQDPDPKVRAMAAWALGQIEDPAAVPALSDALRQDEDATVRLRAAEALGQIEDSRAIEALGDALADPSVEVRRTAVEALGQIEDPRAVPLLLPFLKDRDVVVRRSVAEALGNLESSQAVDGLIEATGDSDLEVRVNAIHALGHIEDPRALPVLAAALRNEAVVIRREAVDAIGSLDLAAAPREVIEAVNDPDREVRQGAIDALDNFEDPAAVPVLLDIVRTSPERDLVYDALDALSGIRSPEVYDALIPLLQHEDPKIRQLAAEAIGDMQ